MNENLPIRILIIGMHDQIGGVETFLMNYYRNIDRKKIQFDFINIYDKLCFQDEIIKLGGNVYNIPNVKKHPIGYCKRLKYILQKNNYNIVHIHMLSAANILPVIISKENKVKHIIVHSHNSNTTPGILRKILDKSNRKILLKNATDFWACSHIAGKWLYGEKKEFHIIHNAIDVEKYIYNEQKRNEMRAKLGLKDKFVIGHIGRFAYQKNHEFLIDIFYRIQKERDNSFLLLIGEGKLRKKIEKKVKTLKIANKVLFLGEINNVEDYLQAMDIFVLPSRFEGLPVVGVEAQANGLKVITSNTVSRELPIKDLNEYCSLTKIESWCDEIKKETVERIDRTTDMTINNYNIKYEVKKMEEKYFSL